MSPQKHLSELTSVARAHSVSYRGVKNRYLVFERDSHEAISRADARLLAASLYRELKAFHDPELGTLVDRAAGIRIA